MKSELQRLLDRYNLLYFEGRLPKCRVVWSKELQREEPGVFAEYDPNAGPGPIIRISTFLRRLENQVALSLLHECVHLLQSDHPIAKDAHDAIIRNPIADALFDYEMLNLAKKGAFNGLW